MIRKVIFFVLLILCVFKSNAQFSFTDLLQGDSDSLYYSDLNNYLTVKAFSSQKFSDFSFRDQSLNNALEYKSNPTRSIGLGMAYKWLGLNVGYGFSFANQDDKQYGKTKRIDLQTRIHLRKLTINLFGSKYQGFYLGNSYTMIKDWPQFTYYTRKDISNTTIGASANYVFNYKKYSNRANYLQNEWQKRSAGSFVLGFSVFYNHLAADSSFVPSNIKNPDFYRGMQWDQNGYFAIGSELGYVFTWVVHDHFFINFGLLGGLATGNTALYPIEDSKLKKFKVNATLISSFGMGYNSKRFYAGVGYNNFISASPSPIDQTNMDYNSGRVSFVIAYRFKVKEGTFKLPEWSPIQL